MNEEFREVPSEEENIIPGLNCKRREVNDDFREVPIEEEHILPALNRQRREPFSFKKTFSNIAKNTKKYGPAIAKGVAAGASFAHTAGRYANSGHGSGFGPSHAPVSSFYSHRPRTGLSAFFSSLFG